MLNLRIPFHKPYITDEELEEVIDAVRSGWLTMGPKTIRFEEEFARYTGAPHALAVNSCTAALHLALKAIDLKAGDEVIVPTMTFTATGEVVAYFGAKPVLVDVEYDTHNIDVARIEAAITPRTKAVIPVHFAGQPCDMDEINTLAKSRGIHVIEDAAHSLPAWYKGRKAGTLGDITCFSFYATKTLSTGEGGMVTTASKEWAERIKTLRLHGISKDAWKRYSGEGSWYYEVMEAGFKYNMTDLQAGLGLAQLKKLEWMWKRRKDIAIEYSDFLKSCALETPCVKPGRESAWHLYVIKLDIERLSIDRASFIEELKRRGIDTSVHFIPLHRHPYYREAYSPNPKDFPNAERIFERSVSLPIYPGMEREEVSHIISTISEVLEERKR